MRETIQSKFWKKKSFIYSIKKNNSFFSWKLKHGKKFFSKIIKLTKPKSVIEIGSNIGLNIHYLREIDKNKKIKIDVIEINKKICEILSKKKELKINQIINKDIINYKIKNQYNLVFTVGVLIHINPKYLKNVINKIISLSNKYILIVEYFSHEPEKIENYKGRNNLLFKRDFGKLFLKKNIHCVDYGFLWQEKERVFDNLNWWLFKKEK